MHDITLSPEDHEVLDNLGWHALTTAHQALAMGDGPARRYPEAVTVFAAIEHDRQAAWDALGAVALADETVVLMRGEPVEVGRGFTRVGGGFGNQMVYLPPSIDTATNGLDIVPLGREHVDQMLTLIDLAQPGPFRQRTIELGNYHGVFDASGDLIAMAGERFQSLRFTEVSAVCTHPDARGQGLAAAVTQRVVAGILERGQVPVLHVAHGNDNAQRVYERLGFTRRRAVSFTAVRRNP